MRRRLSGSPLAAALAAAVLTTGACGVSGPGGSGDDLPRKTGVIEGDITFRTLQLKPTFTGYIQGVIDSFEKEHPDVTVKWEDVPGEGYNEKLVADAQAGSLPDVVNVNTDSFQLLADRGILADISRLDPQAQADFVPGAWDQYKLPGKGNAVYAYPWYVTPEILTYNKDLFRKSGLDMGKPPTTVEELFDCAEQIAERSGGAYSAFMADPAGRLPGDWQKMGVPILDEAGDEFIFDTAKTVEWVERMTSLYAKGAMPRESLTGAADINQLYGAAKLVFGPGSPGFVKDIKENAPEVYEDTGVAEAITGTLGHIGIYTQSVGVRKDTDHVDAAAAFAKWVTNGPNQVEFSQHATVYPSNAEGLDDPRFTDPGDGSDAETAARATGAGLLREAQLDANTPVQWTSQVGDAVVRHMQKAIKGDISAQSAIEKALRDANEILAKQRDQ
ncbi:sugar ABC transporter substrate-binding protein [Streptomyces sp. MUM 203J]|uniref:ABC transporter substrate-binding protein n=1 Tax=Streptomyces sp. MUM 203J TaxID=2791990 RepID=UPI001F03BCC0|nr:sugar ABC transporter substrate-binding protein [Streptomyces sp. MUM 203J]MCH0539163.1 sugar ABC transporter substrate-binding protein [Streptomyces sp. MUM 203J]